MTQRTKTLSIVFGGAIVLVIAGAVIFLLMQKKEEPLTNTTVTNKNVNVVVVNTVQTNENQNTNTAAVDATVAARRLANLFVERFGSYSSEAQFQNIVDLKKFMTKKMQAWADTYISDQKKQAGTNTSFQSITAKVITTSVTNQSASGITFRITTVRTTDNGAVNGKNTYNQDILIRAVPSGTDWKIDSAYWQD
jgi:hypothetical protein